MGENKLKLSKNILEMKFMKKYKDKAEKDAEREETSLLFNSEMSESLIKGGDQCIFEPSYVPCEQLQFGRFSFKGMNPEIEQLMRDNQLKNLDKLKAMDGISPKEMANRYSTLVNTLGKKFTPKRKQVQEKDDNSPRKLKFLKPTENS